MIAPRAIAIGASVGGPAALERVLAELPDELDVPVFVVQHMPAEFTPMLARRLAHAAGRPVTEVTRTQRIELGGIYLAKGDAHLIVDGPNVRPSVAAPENSCRPSVDVLFRSVAETYGASALAIVLTGMGADGARGAEVVRAHGGCVIAQDQGSSVVWGMPGAVVKAGLADATCALDQIGNEIERRLSTRVIPVVLP